MADCPVCDAAVPLANDTVLGEVMECPDCGTELEVTGLEPAALSEAPQTEEDWGE
jgi:alpha-aminoadipate carrier protein LysW